MINLQSLPLAVVDVESTGLDDDSRCVEVAVVHLELGGRALPRIAFQSRVNPEAPMSWKASTVTGITDADLKSAPTFDEVGPHLLKAMQGRVVTAYNAPADFAWIHRDATRVGLHAPPWPWLDVLIWAKEVDKYESSKSLAQVCQRRGIAVDAHGAAGDALATALVFEPLLREHAYPSSPTTHWPTLDALLAWQRATALAQEVEYCEFILRRHGAQNRPRPDCDWHLLEGEELPFWPEPTPPMGRCLRCRQPVVYAVAQDGSVEMRGPDGANHDCA